MLLCGYCGVLDQVGVLSVVIKTLLKWIIIIIFFGTFAKRTFIYLFTFLNYVCDWFAPKYCACAVGIFQYFCLYTWLRFSNITEKNYHNWNKVGDWPWPCP